MAVTCSVVTARLRNKRHRLLLRKGCAAAGAADAEPPATAGTLADAAVAADQTASSAAAVEETADVVAAADAGRRTAAAGIDLAGHIA